MTLKDIELFVDLKELEGTASSPTFFFCLSIVDVLMCINITKTTSIESLKVSIDRFDDDDAEQQQQQQQQ